MEKHATKLNILGIWHLATSEEKLAGAEWYSTAHVEACRLAQTYNVPLVVSVGVIAALSPNNRWERNLADAQNLIEAYMRGDDVTNVKVCTYHAMRAKAWAILNLGHQAIYNEVVIALHGRKITSFFENIMGEDGWGAGEARCTIDGHARNIAYGERLTLTGGKFTIGKREYAALQELYREAAREVGVPAYVMQAVTWVTWRRMHNI